MNILFDHQIFSFQDYGGISRYHFELAKGFRKLGFKVEVEGKFSNNIYLKKIKENTTSFLPGINFPYKNLLLFYANNLFGEKIVKSGAYDFLHATYYHPYFLNILGGKKYVITAHDMIHELFNKDYKDLRNKTSEFKKKTIMGADQIIAVSENTKKDLINIYKINPSKINVIHHGCSLQGVAPQIVVNLPSKYFLFVGNRLGYKNFAFFLKSVSQLLLKNKDTFLVCAGANSFSISERKLLERLGVSSKVKHISFTGDGELAYLYKKAICYVIPSLYEGFGMTILEAFAMDCPVVASKVSSIPEVAGDAVTYINPNSHESISKAIEKLMNSKKLREKLVAKGKKQLKKYSWEKCVKETIKVYNKVI